MKLERNANYWRKDADGKQLPYLDEIEFVTIPDDATRILKLQAGEVDGAEFIPYARVAELKADPNLEHGAVPVDQGQLPHPECPPDIQGRRRRIRCPIRRSGRR